MKKSIAVYEITNKVSEIELDEIKVRNINSIFESIIGVNGQNTNHISIKAEIKSDDSILKAYSDKQDDFSIKNFADKLLESEKSPRDDSRKKTIREGFLFIKESPDVLLLLKLEKTSVADTETFEVIGQLGTEKNYYKACILKRDLTTIEVIDKSRRIANYWLEGFLGLQEVRNSKVNSTELIELVESKELFTDSIREQDNFSEILFETKSYIFDNSQFDKSDLIDFLNGKDLIDIATDQQNYESLFYSGKSSGIDANFAIDSKVLRDKYKREIKISNETSIKTDNFEKLKRGRGIQILGNEVRLTISEEFLEGIRQLLE